MDRKAAPLEIKKNPLAGDTPLRGVPACSHTFANRVILSHNWLLKLSACTTVQSCVEGAFALLDVSLNPSHAFVIHILPNEGGVENNWSGSNVFLRIHGADLQPCEWEEAWADHPLREYLAENPGIRVVPEGVRWPMARGDRAALTDCRFHRTVRRFGWYSSLDLAFWEGGVLRGVCSICRTKEQGAFRPDERELAETVLQPSLESAFLRVLAAQQQAARVASLQRLVRAVEGPVFVLDWELLPVAASDPAKDACEEWEYGSQILSLAAEGNFRLPATIRSACERLKRDWIKARDTGTLDLLEKMFVLRHPSQECLSARVELVVSGEWVPPTDVVRCLCEGRTNDEIASTLGKSVATVKKQLTGIYRKLGVSSRTELVALAGNLNRPQGDC